MESSPQSLSELLRLMRSLTSIAGANRAHEVMEQFESVTGGGIQLHYNIIEKSQDARKATRGKYANFAGCKKALLTLTYKKDFEGTRNRLQREANGAIVQFPEWKLLSIMPAIADQQPPEKELKSSLSDYNIFPLNDGTVVTYYHYNDKWVPSTSNAIDASNHTWLGASTYAMVLKELLGTHKNFSFAKLQKNRCYTFVFKHPDFHPFMAESPRISLVQSVGDKMDISYTEDIGVPLCKMMSITYEKMRTSADNALETFVRSRSVDDINYGYILRSKTPEKRDYCIESTLMKYIRKTIYDLPPANTMQGSLSGPNQRIFYIVLRAIMVPDFHTYFLKVFPQFEDLWLWCDELLNNLANKVIVMHAGSNRDGASPTIEESTARILTEKLRHENININSSHAKSIITDFVRDTGNLSTLHMCILKVYEQQKGC